LCGHRQREVAQWFLTGGAGRNPAHPAHPSSVPDASRQLITDDADARAHRAKASSSHSSCSIAWLLVAPGDAAAEARGLSPRMPRSVTAVTLLGRAMCM